MGSGQSSERVKPRWQPAGESGDPSGFWGPGQGLPTSPDPPPAPSPPPPPPPR